MTEKHARAAADISALLDNARDVTDAWDAMVRENRALKRRLKLVEGQRSAGYCRLDPKDARPPKPRVEPLDVDKTQAPYDGVE